MVPNEGRKPDGQAAGALPGDAGPREGGASTGLPPLPEAVRAELHWIASEGSPSLARHARIVLARYEGRSLSDIARVLDVDRATVRRWLSRFEKAGIRGLVHASTGRARKRRFGESVRDAVARLAMTSPIAAGEPFGRWSLRRLRRHLMRRGIVENISVEGLRQLLTGLPLPPAYWRRGTPPVGPLAEDVRRGLEHLARCADLAVARRARMVLARSRGLSEAEVAAALNVGRNAVRRWLQRFERHGILGLQASRRTPRPAVFTPEVRATIVRHAQMPPRQGNADRWSLRSLQASLIRSGIVRKISIQHLRRILAEAGVTLKGTARPGPARAAHH